MIYAVFSEFIILAFGLLLPRLWIVNYGSEVNGLLSSLNQFLVYLGLFEAGVGAATLQALYKPVSEDNWDGINGVLSATNHYYKHTSRYYFIGLVLLAAVYPLIAKSTLPYHTIFGAVFFSGFGNVVLFYFQGKFNFFLQAEGKNYIITNLNTIVSILTSLSKVLLISLNVDIVLILMASFVIQCMQACYIMWYMRRYKKLNLKVEPNLESISQKNSILVHQVSGLIFNNTDVLILTAVCNLKIVSVYALFKMISSQVESLLRIPLNSIRFILGQTFHADRKLFIKRIDLVESYNSALQYALFSVTLFLYLPFIRLYTEGVTDINYVDPLLAILFVTISLLDRSRAPMLMTIEFAGHFRNTIRQTIVEATINLVVSLVGVHFLGIYGVLLGTVVALGWRSIDIICYTNRRILERSPFRTLSVYLLNLGLFLLTQLLLRNLFDASAITSYLRFALVGAASSVLSLCIFVLGQTLVFSRNRAFVLQLLRRVFPHM
ncbi:MAG: sugar isomerase [Oscillospiraceae bacterium]|nr:sugar isomerase [Oscillospiraceae bacterium]